MIPTSNDKIDRRKFLGTAATASLLFIKPELVRGTAANSAVRLGLLGCGGRGTTVATSFANNTSARVVALSDLLPDQLEAAKKKFDDLAQQKGYAGIDHSQMFKGPKAYEQIVASKEVDAVLIATPPYYHPEHLEAAVAAGKHIYLEKPVAVDVPGAKRVRRAGEKVQGRFSLDVGFQLRHATPYVEMVKRIHAGALGDIVCGLLYYYAGAIPRPEWPTASPVERRLRNWIYDRVLSGDILVEQNIHLIDVTNWVLQAHPVKAIATGGRKGRTDPGDCWSHYNCTFTYPSDIHISLCSTQFIKGSWDVAMRYFGSKGNAELHYDAPVRLVGDEPWEAPGIGKPQAAEGAAAAKGVFRGAIEDADPEKEKSFIESIASGNYHNQAAAGAESALSAMLGRMAAYTGREVTWDELLRSKEVWDAKIDLNKLG